MESRSTNLAGTLDISYSYSHQYSGPIESFENSDSTDRNTRTMNEFRTNSQMMIRYGNEFERKFNVPIRTSILDNSSSNSDENNTLNDRYSTVIPAKLINLE
jgi:hypothetical protein